MEEGPFDSLWRHVCNVSENGLGTLQTPPQQIIGGIYARRAGKKRKRLFRHEMRRGEAHLISPGGNRGGFSTSIASATGCCGFFGPKPSATLDKIPNRIFLTEQL